jgi:hypothetical protein
MIRMTATIFLTSIQDTCGKDAGNKASL